MGPDRHLSIFLDADPKPTFFHSELTRLHFMFAPVRENHFKDLRTFSSRHLMIEQWLQLPWSNFPNALRKQIWIVRDRCQFVQLMLETRTTIWQCIPSTFWDMLDDYLWTLVMHISPSPSPPNLLTRCCRLCHLKTCHGSLHHVLVESKNPNSSREDKVWSTWHPKDPNQIGALSGSAITFPVI